MENADGSRGQENINQHVISNERKLFDILHDQTISAEDKLPQMTEVLSGGYVNVNFLYENNRLNTLLHGAASYGFVDVVKLLLEYKADIDSKNSEKETPLHIAVSRGFLDVVKHLLKYEPDVASKNAKKETPLHIAVYHGFADIVEMLQGAVVDLQNAEGEVGREDWWVQNTSGVTQLDLTRADNLLASHIKFNNDTLVDLNEHMIQNTCVNVVASIESKLTLILVAQAIEHSGSYKECDGYMWMRVSSLLPCGNNEERTMEAFKSRGKHNLLVIDCISMTEKIPEDQLTTLGNTLLEITTNNPQKKLVLIAPENHVLAEMFRSNSGYYYLTVTWKDLTNETQDILLATQVDFQGQLVKLNQVIDKTETELLEIVPLETLIRDERLVIGTELPTSIDYDESFYINRSVNSVNQVVLKKDIFEVKSKRKLKEGFTLKESDFQNQCNMNPGANIHLIEKQGDRFIWVKSQGELKALRPYIDFTNYQSCSEEEFLNSVKLQRIVIISDLPGMGKTTVLTHFCNIIKAKCKRTLIFRIDLNNYTKLFKSHKEKTILLDHSGALEFLFNEIIMIKTPLEKALFKRKGNVVLLFDGFDEINRNFEGTVCGFIQKITEATMAQIWITTRPLMKEKLEDQLRQWSSSLESFSNQTQVDYLTKYWKRNVVDITDSEEGKIKVFASSLISKLSESISDKERGFIGMPLQMKMVAECFIDDFENSPELEKCLNLVELYKKFVDKKFEIFYKKNAIDFSKIGAGCMQERSLYSCITQHRRLAFSVVLSEDKSALLLPDLMYVINLSDASNVDLNDCSNDDSNETITIINQIGIVNVNNGKPHFVHRTFAEYLVAEYFAKLMELPKCMSPSVQYFILSELLISNNYLLIRAFINGLIAKYQPAKDTGTDTVSEFQTPLLTRDDINNKYEEIKQIFNITAIEGNDHILKHLLNSIEGKDESVTILLYSTVENNKTLLHVAAANNNAKFIKTLLQWIREYKCDARPFIKRHLKLDEGQKKVQQLLEACDSNNQTSLHLASARGHNDVIWTLLDWTRDNFKEDQEIVKRMLEACDKDDLTSLQLASGNGRNDVVQTLLQWTCDNLDDCRKTVTRMLEKDNSFGETSLICASKYGHNDAVQTLLQWPRDKLGDDKGIVTRMLDACDINGQTSLHWASKGGNTDVVQTLLQCARDNVGKGQESVNCMLEECDGCNETSLHMASERGHNDVVQTLLQCARDNLGEDKGIVKRMLEACDSDDITPLHRASWQGHNDVVQTLLQCARDNFGESQGVVKRMLEAFARDGKTSLHWASWQGHNDVVQTLLQYARDNLGEDQGIAKRLLEARDSSNQTSLHRASWQGHNDVVQTLLWYARENLGEDQGIVKGMLEAYDSDGMTSLNRASWQGHNDVVQTLLQCARDNFGEGQGVMKRILEACNKDGKTSLHWASEAGRHDVVQTLLQWTLGIFDDGQEIVKRMLETYDRDRRTLLHLASGRGHSLVVQTLLQWTRDNLVGGQDMAKWMLEARDKQGLTSLQWALKRRHKDVAQTLMLWTPDSL